MIGFSSLESVGFRSSECQLCRLCRPNIHFSQFLRVSLRYWPHDVSSLFWWHTIDPPAGGLFG